MLIRELKDLTWQIEFSVHIKKLTFAFMLRVSYGLSDCVFLSENVHLVVYSCHCCTLDILIHFHSLERSKLFPTSGTLHV